MNDALKRQLEEALKAFRQMTPKQRQDILDDQAASWVRGEMAAGGDAQEAVERAQFRQKEGKR